MIEMTHHVLIMFFISGNVVKNYFSRIEALESFLYDCLISIFELSVIALTNVNNDVNNNAAT